MLRYSVQLLFVHLPTKKPIKRLQNGRDLKYQNLLEQLQATYELIDPSPSMIRHADQYSPEELFADRSSHYSKTGNQIVGGAIAKALLNR